MATLSKPMLILILNHLDLALAETRKTDSARLESEATWRIRMARESLLHVAIADIAVEQIPAEAA